MTTQKVKVEQRTDQDSERKTQRTKLKTRDRRTKEKASQNLTEQELQTAIDCLQKGKSGDNKGIKAEDIKGCDDDTKRMMREIFNEVIVHDSINPETTRKMTIREISKKRRRRKSGELQSNLYTAYFARRVLNTSIQQASQQA